jgi:hypothetical protein
MGAALIVALIRIAWVASSPSIDLQAAAMHVTLSMCFSRLAAILHCRLQFHPGILFAYTDVELKYR